MIDVPRYGVESTNQHEGSEKFCEDKWSAVGSRALFFKMAEVSGKDAATEQGVMLSSVSFAAVFFQNCD